jgi:hypothetical protein
MDRKIHPARRRTEEEGEGFANTGKGMAVFR